MRIAIISSLIITSALLSSCFPMHTPFSNQKNDAAIQTMPATLTILETLDSSKEPTAIISVEETKNSNILTKYTFRIMVDYDQHYAEVNEIIEYQNKTGERLTLIHIIIPPDQYQNSFILNNYSSEPSSELIAPVEANDPWTVDFDDPLEASEIVKISINYMIRLPARTGSFGYTASQANFQNWYPFIPPLDLWKGWLINDYSLIGEYIVSDKADFYVNIQTNREVIIAGAGEEVLNKDHSISFTHLNTRDFTFSVSPDYQKLSSDLGNVVINAYVFPGDEEAGKEMIRNTTAALVYFESLYDLRYPHQTLNIVEADFPDGMEADGMYFLSKKYLDDYDGTHRNYLTILSVHETAHQWFYGIVGNDQATEPWLDEALCTLSEVMFFEEFYPSDVEWWWNYRVDSFSPTGKVDGSIYQYDDLRTYINSVYLQGVRFLQDLRTMVGDELFITTLREYVLTNENQIADGDDFFQQFDLFDMRSFKEIYFSQ